MKNRIFACLLSAVLLLGMTSCGNDTAKDPQQGTPASSVTTAAPTAEVTTKLPEIGGASTETVLKLNALTEGIRVLGIRENVTDGMLNCDLPGSGFEFSINSKGGTVNVRTRTSNACTFRVFVDGVAHKNAAGSEEFVINGVKNIEIPNITEGEHTIRVVRVTEAGGVTSSFYNVTFEGTQIPLTADENALTVEFVGDGNLLGDDVTTAYAYLTANKLTTSYGISAYVGQGLMNGSAPVTNSYGKTGNYSKDAEIVVIDLGAVDLAANLSQEDLALALTSFFTTVRTVNSPITKIVCVSAASNEALTAAMAAACTAAGGENAGFYAKALTETDAAAMADTLAAYITSIKDLAVASSVLQAGSSGYGVEIEYDSNAWIS